TAHPEACSLQLAACSAAWSLQPAAGFDRFGVNWHGRTVLVVGLARSGIAAAHLLHRIGCVVRVSEKGDSDLLRTSADRLRQAGIEQIELGRHREEIMEGCHAVVVSPGVPESNPVMQWASERAIPILSEVELAFRFCMAPIVAVTGTNGKSSVATLIHRVLAAAGRPSVVCGNIGTPFSSILSSLSPEAVAVVEVSSFQLLWCEQFRPMIGVLLNVGTNHLDRHPDQEAYVAAKARLLVRQTPHDYAVLNARDPVIATLSERLCARRVWFGDSNDRRDGFALDPETCRLLPVNLQAVLQVGRLLGVPDPLVYQVIREFPGLEHRLEHVATIHGVTVVNDAKSTTPDSFLYAVERCQGPVVAILGGKDKGLNFDGLQGVLRQERMRGVVLIGESRSRLRALLNGSATVRECDTLEQAVREAMSLAHAGDTLLFSPACASFDMFRNFEERGRVFKQLVRQLERENRPPSTTFQLQASSFKLQATRGILEPGACSL
ncbi:MAG: UDP-N-acetylmuramoyl-L-alanine--D-glutamate ligase, partial [Candidatus Omnitrophica bacterium]|nr:UDP-N-acetylmuramoyl-L-alanine--D-glutamate ligase [Candidatus Omnitrophota bacterium]